MRSVFTLWIGQPIILQVAADNLRVPLRGMIVGESDASVAFRIHDGADEIDIHKVMVLAIEEDHSVSVLVN